MTDRNIIGQKIAELRRNKGMTQAELADKLGVSHQAVSQWERSETLPDILTLPQIAEIFGESIGSLLGIEEVKPEPEPIPVDIDKLMDEGEKKKPAVEVNNSDSAEVFINDRKVDNSSTQLDAKNFSLPESENTIDLNRDSDYEVAVIQDGRIIKKFRGNPDDHLKIYLIGECRDLHSEMSVDVQGNVGGNAQSGFGMTIGGDVGGNATSGFEMKCGDVGGNANAGFDLHCGSIDGEANGGFGIKKNKDKSEHISSGESDAEFSVDGMNVTIEGNYNGNLSTAACVTVQGNVHGSVTSEQCVTVEGDVDGNVSAGDSMTVDGDVGGNAAAGDSMNIGGDVGMSVSAGDNVTIEGDVNGDISAGCDIRIEGDLNGDIIQADNVTIEGDSSGSGSCTFSADGQTINIEGDYDGDLSTAANVTVHGNISGDVDCSNLTVEGDIEGDVDAKGNVTVEGGDIEGDVDAGGNVTVEGGDINGDISTTGDIRVSGDVNGDIRGKNITVEGDYNG